MEQRVSVITLAVGDLELAATFYENLGWQRVASPDGVIAFDLIGQTLGLYSRVALADELGIPADAIGGFSGVTLAHNVRQREEVIAVLDTVRRVGGRVLKEAQEVFWGGFHGYFVDPDGHVWEVVHNPFSTLREDGAFRWQGF